MRARCGPIDLVLTPQFLRFAGRNFAYVAGQGGISARKIEGDGATPVGVHRIVGCLYRADRLARPSQDAIAIGPRDLWSDAPNDPHYNQKVRRPYSASAERLMRGDRLYDLVLLTDWNWPNAAPGRGSAIFIHRWRGPGRPTEGCIGLAPSDLKWIAARLRPRSRLIVPTSMATRSVFGSGAALSEDR